MQTPSASDPDPDRPDTGWYELRVKGHLDARWATWFDGMTLTRHSDGTTVLCGPVPDQAALHGLLQKVRDVGLPLVSVITTAPRRPEEPTQGGEPA